MASGDLPFLVPHPSWTPAPAFPVLRIKRTWVQQFDPMMGPALIGLGAVSQLRWVSIDTLQYGVRHHPRETTPATDGYNWFDVPIHDEGIPMPVASPMTPLPPMAAPNSVWDSLSESQKDDLAKLMQSATMRTKNDDL